MVCWYIDLCWIKSMFLCINNLHDFDGFKHGLNDDFNEIIGLYKCMKDG